MGEDGRLTLHLKGRSDRSEPQPPDEGDEAPAAETPPLGEAPAPQLAIKDLVMAYVSGCNARGNGPSKRQIRKNVPGDNQEVDAAVDELVEDGKAGNPGLEIRLRKGQGGGNSYWVTAGIPPS